MHRVYTQIHLLSYLNYVYNIFILYTSRASRSTRAGRRRASSRSSSSAASSAPSSPSPTRQVPARPCCALIAPRGALIAPLMHLSSSAAPPSPSPTQQIRVATPAGSGGPIPVTAGPGPIRVADPQGLRSGRAAPAVRDARRGSGGEDAAAGRGSSVRPGPDLIYLCSESGDWYIPPRLRCDIVAPLLRPCCALVASLLRPCCAPVAPLWRLFGALLALRRALTPRPRRPGGGPAWRVGDTELEKLWKWVSLARENLTPRPCRPSGGPAPRRRLVH